MSDVIGIVLKMTLGLFVKKARSSLSDKLKDGGLNSQQLRNLIISKLQNLEKKLDGLARANLRSSVSRIQEGLRLLGDLLDKPNTPTLPLQEDDDKENSTRASNTGQASSSESKALLDVDLALKLAEVIDELKRNSGDYFTLAVELFKEANTKATEAFHNEALSVEDRILAAKLRVQSRLLLSLDNPSLASQPCRLYLEELHGLAPIVKDFRNYLEGGMAAVVNKEKRRELVLCVSAINLVAFKFLKSCTKGPVNLYDWPKITRGDWTYSPLIPDKTVYVEQQSAVIKFSNLIVFKEIGFTDQLCYRTDAMATNSVGDFFVETQCEDLLKITKRKVKVQQKRMEGFSLFGLAIDINDITYVLFVTESLEYSPSGTLEPEDICVGILDSFKSLNTSFRPVKLDECVWKYVPAVSSTPDGFALVKKESTGTYNVAFYQNNQGNVTCKFAYSIEMNPNYSWLTTVTNKYHLVAAEKFSYHLRVYKKDGQLIREFELYGGECESCVSIAFNYLTEELVCVSLIGRWFYLSTYELETGVRRHKARLTLFGKYSKSILKFAGYPRLTAHCNGPMSVVSEEYALRFQ